MANIIEKALRNNYFWGKFRGFFMSKNLKLELQLGTLGLVIFNYLIVFILMANPKIPGRDVVKESRTGFLFPITFNRFGSTYSWLNLLLHTLALLPVFVPRSRWRIYLVPSLLWNVYTLIAFIDNCKDILTTMYYAGVPFVYMRGVFFIAVFVTSLLVTFSWAALTYFKFLKTVT